MMESMNKDNAMNEIYRAWNPIDGIGKPLYLEALHDDVEGIRVVLREGGEHGRVLRATFDAPSVFGYRNVNESYRLRTISRMDVRHLPSLIIVENSEWARWIREEAEGTIGFDDIVHYMFSTPEDVVDVVTCFPPVVEWLPPWDES